MPYQPFLEAARAERYDIELLAHRFGTSFEQVCHRLTTLRRPGAEGVPMHIGPHRHRGQHLEALQRLRHTVRAVRRRVPPLERPRRPDDARHDPDPALADARRHRLLLHRAHRAQRPRRLPRPPHGAGRSASGCDVAYARELVYADGIDLDNIGAAMPVGVTCRTCERLDCAQRALPALQHPLRLDENRRGVSFYASVDK